MSWCLGGINRYSRISRMINKQAVHQQCVLLLHKKQQELQDVLKGLTESAANETKSTAGDKHETALAMLQIEQENTSRQLNLLLTQISFLEKIDVSKHHTNVSNGSLVSTNKGLFYIAIALGKILVEDTPIFVLSLQSPLGNKLSGLQQGDYTELNGTKYNIVLVS